MAPKGSRSQNARRSSRAIVVPGLLGALFLVALVLPVQADEGGSPGGSAEAFQPGSPSFTLHGFSDVNFRVESVKPDGADRRTAQAFSLGQFDLYMVSRLANSLSFLSETVFKLQANGTQVVEVERLFVKYSLLDQFKVAAGRTHTALGYWNEAYHHGALLHPTVARPEILKFGGVMPLHALGLEFSGRFPISGWELAYVANVANGRALDHRVTQGAGDLNSQKAEALKLSLGHEGDGSLLLGGMIYHDVIPPDHAMPPRAHEIQELIPGAHLVFRGGPLEVMAEYFQLLHDEKATGQDWTHKAGYAIAVWKAGPWKPYAGVDVTEFEEGDLYLSKNDIDVTRYLGGIRFDLSHLNAIKLELRHEDRKGGTTNALAIQTAFAF